MVLASCISLRLFHVWLYVRHVPTLSITPLKISFIAGVVSCGSAVAVAVGTAVVFGVFEGNGVGVFTGVLVTLGEFFFTVILQTSFFVFLPFLIVAVKVVLPAFLALTFTAYLPLFLKDAIFLLFIFHDTLYFLAFFTVIFFVFPTVIDTLFFDSFGLAAASDVIPCTPANELITIAAVRTLASTTFVFLMISNTSFACIMSMII